MLTLVFCSEWRIFEPMREEVAGSWGEFHNEELHNLYGSPFLLRICGK
jgi:hypothetical protein